MPGFVKVATIGDIPNNSMKAVEVEGQQILVCHYGNDFYAIGNICTHDNAPLGAGRLCDGQVECPRHGARFDITNGKPTCLPAVTGVPVYKLELRGQEVWVSPN